MPEHPTRSPLSGVVKAALELARAQRNLGNDVTVGAAGLKGWHSEWNGVHLLSLKSTDWAKFEINNKSYDFRQHLALMRHLAFHRYDILHAHLYFYMKFLHVPVKVVHFHADPLNEGSALGSVEWKMVTAHGTGGIAVSEYVAERVRTGIGASSWPLQTVVNGVKIHEEPSSSRILDFMALRQRLGIGKDDFVFLFAGAFAEAKGLHILAQSFIRLSNELPSVHLVLAGGSQLWDGAMGTVLPKSYEASVRRLLYTLEQMGRVHYLGSVSADSMPVVYGASNVLVVPSIWNEAFSLVTLESLASGVPVIASRVGGIPEILNVQTGILVKSDDVGALAEAMNTVVVDKDLYEEMRRHCRPRATRFTWPRAANELMDFYKNLGAT